jgi:hypothetical protein
MVNTKITVFLDVKTQLFMEAAGYLTMMFLLQSLQSTNNHE